MKKIIALLLALVMALSLAACGGTNTDATEPQQQEAQTIKVAAIETAYGSLVFVCTGIMNRFAGADGEDVVIV